MFIKSIETQGVWLGEAIQMYHRYYFCGRENRMSLVHIMHAGHIHYCIVFMQIQRNMQDLI